MPISPRNGTKTLEIFAFFKYDNAKKLENSP